jgi:hypothetical protein
MLDPIGTCSCIPAIPPSYNGVPEDKCNVPCPGHPGQFCGGPDGEVSVYVAECPAGEIRFADHCYFKSSLGDAGIANHQDDCSIKVSDTFCFVPIGTSNI